PGRGEDRRLPREELVAHARVELLHALELGDPHRRLRGAVPALLGEGERDADGRAGDVLEAEQPARQALERDGLAPEPEDVGEVRDRLIGEPALPAGAAELREVQPRPPREVPRERGDAARLLQLVARFVRRAPAAAARPGPLAPPQPAPGGRTDPADD